MLKYECRICGATVFALCTEERLDDCPVCHQSLADPTASLHERIGTLEKELSYYRRLLQTQTDSVETDQSRICADAVSSLQ